MAKPDHIELPTGETKWLVFKESSIHGRGGFAKTDILSGTRVIEYLGEKITKQESVRRCEASNHFIFALNDREDLDGNVDWNLARLINHSCAPNCEVEWDGSHLWILAKRDIKAGQEITFNYGYDLIDYRDYSCTCGSAECVGYIVAEAYFEKLRDLHSHSQRLSTYPADPSRSHPSSCA